MLKNKPIKIGILEASPQTKAVLEFFFSSSGKSIFKESSIEEAAAFIIDYDYPGSKERWKELFKETKKPGILASIKETDLNSTFWVAKPLTSKDLIKAGENIREFLEHVIVEPTVKKVEIIAEEAKEIASLAIPNKENQKNNTTIKPKKEVQITAKEPVKQKENAELAFSGADESQLGALDLSDDFEDFSKDIALNAPKKESKEPVSKANLLNDFPTDFIEIQDTAVETELLDDNAASDLETNLMKSIPSTPNFAVSPTLIKVDESIEENPAVDELSLKEEKTVTNDSYVEPSVDKDYKLMEESEIDSLLKTLISGGKIKQAKEENEYTTVEDISNVDLFTTDTENSSESVKMDSDFIDFTIDTPSSKSETATFDVESDLAPSPEKNNESLKNSIEDASQDTEEMIDFTFELPSVDEQDYLIENESHESKKEGQQSIIQDDGSSMDFATLQEIELENKIDLDNSVNSVEVGGSLIINSIKPKAETKVTGLKSAEDELQNLLEEIRKEAEAGAETSSSPTFASDGSGSNSNHIPTSAEERWAHTCGINIKITKNKEAKGIAFNPEDYLLSAFLNVCEQSRYTDNIMRLKIRSQLFIIDYNRDFVYHDKSIFTDAYAEVCQRTINPIEIKIHDLDQSEQRLYQQKITDDAEHCHTVDSFIWTTSLLISRGRLPQGTDINNKVGLKYWPNLTRLEQIPNGMQIAAVFYKHPGSLVEISNWSKIDQRYIFAFYNASLSLELIELDGKKIRSTPNLKGSHKKNKNRGFFSRLLKRIKS